MPSALGPSSDASNTRTPPESPPRRLPSGSPSSEASLDSEAGAANVVSAGGTADSTPPATPVHAADGFLRPGAYGSAAAFSCEVKTEFGHAEYGCAVDLN